MNSVVAPDRLHRAQSIGWTFLFGSATGRQVAWRMAVDFVLAHTVLIVASVWRLVVNGSLSPQNPLGNVVDRINSVYLMHAAWFSASAIALFALSGLYRPKPNARIAERLWVMGRACLLGFACHFVWGTAWTDRARATLEFGAPAWTLLFGAVAVTRFSRFSLSNHFRVVSRRPSRSNTVEDVLIVGGAGYVGSILTRQLLNAGYRVRVLDLQLFGLGALQEIQGHRRLEIQTGDFRNVEHVVRALRGMDAVVHLAAIVGDPACALDEETTIAVNYEAAKMIAELSRANGISRFIFASTCSVYGDGSAHDLIDEEGQLNPVSLYATTKIDAEQALREVADDVFQPTMLRFGTAYGLSHRPRFDLVANLFSAKAVTDGVITVFNGHLSRPFIHVRDMARAIVLAMEAPLHKVGNQVFNVGDSSQNYTISQLGQMISDLVPGTRVEESRNAEDPRSYRVSFDKIRDRLGFRASIDVKEGVREMIEAVRDGKIGDWHDPIYSNQQEMQRSALKLLKFPERKQPEEAMSATRQFLRRAA